MTKLSDLVSDFALARNDKPDYPSLEMTRIGRFRPILVYLGFDRFQFPQDFGVFDFLILSAASIHGGRLGQNLFTDLGLDGFGQFGVIAQVIFGAFAALAEALVAIAVEGAGLFDDFVGH